MLTLTEPEARAQWKEEERMLNSVSLMGRLTREPEFRTTPSQVPVTTVTIACDRDFSGRESEQKTDFIDCVAWRGTAEFIQRYFHKGSMIIMEGRLQMRSWTDRDGGRHEKAEILAENVYFGDSRKKED